MKKILFFVLSISITVFSQEDDSYNLDYNNSQNAAELCTKIKASGFLSNAEADDALAKILSVVGASKRFIVAPCENINNALAIIEDDMRYILYDPEFINSISETSNYWSNMSILAHEVGHHINGHTLGSSISAYENKIQELEADEFSGFVMQKLGATLAEATDAIASISPSGDDTYSSHPNKERRIKAITKGYDNAKNNSYVKEKKLNDWEEYYFRGIEKSENGDYEGAIEDFTESLKLKPDAKTYYFRARSKGEIDDYSGEKFDYIRSIELNPTDWEPYYYLGLNLYYSNDYYGSLSAFNKYLNSTQYTGDFYDIWTGYYMALSLFNEGIYTKSLNYINYIITETDLKSIIGSDYHPNFYILRGRIHLESENIELAKKDFEIALELNPDNDFTLELIGDTYSKEKQYDKAVEFYNKALEINPSKHSIYEYRAYAHEALEDYFNALVDMNEAIKHAPDYGYLYFKRGYYSFKMGNNKTACSDWLLGNEKGDPDSLKNLLEFCGYNKEDFFSAEDYYNASDEEKNKGNYTEAIRLLNKSKEMGYDNIIYLKASYFSIYFKSGNYDLALGMLNDIPLDDLSENQLVWWNDQFLYTNVKLENWSDLIDISDKLISQYKLDPDALDYSLDLKFLKDNSDFVFNVFDSFTTSLSNIGEYEKAMMITDKFMKIGKVLENNHFIKSAYLSNGIYKMETRDNLGALQDINEYIKISEDLSIGYKVRGEIKLNMGEAYSEYACEDFNLALEICLKNEDENEQIQQELQNLIDTNCK